MGKLVAVYGDQVELEEALRALQDAGLADKAHVVGNGYVEAGEAADGDTAVGSADRAAARGSQPGERVVIPPAAASSGMPPGNPTMLAPLVAPAGRSHAGVVGVPPGEPGTPGDLETITGGNAEEARHYANVLNGGGSLLVVEGDASELDRAEQALARHGGQGMVRR